MPDQRPMWTRCLGGFSVMWVTKLLISPVKKRIFCPKSTKFGPKMAFLFILGQALPAHLVHLVGGCGARAVPRNTPIYFITMCVNMFNIHSFKCSIHSTRSNIPAMILICSIDTFNKFNICANSLYWISIVHQQKGKWERLHQGCTSLQFEFKDIEIAMKIDRNITTGTKKHNKYTHIQRSDKYIMNRNEVYSRHTSFQFQIYIRTANKNR